VFLFETDVSGDWRTAASPELDLSNQCYYELSETNSLMNVTGYDFACRSSDRNSLWVGAKDLAGAGAATVELTLRWVVRAYGAVEIS
jgi:hypothetical protein